MAQRETRKRKRVGGEGDDDDSNALVIDEQERKKRRQEVSAPHRLAFKFRGDGMAAAAHCTLRLCTAGLAEAPQQPEYAWMYRHRRAGLKQRMPEQAQGLRQEEWLTLSFWSRLDSSSPRVQLRPRMQRRKCRQRRRNASTPLLIVNSRRSSART